MNTSRKGSENRITNLYGMSDYWRYYNKKYHKEVNKYNINRKLYTTIISEFNKEIAEDLTFKIKDFKLPFLLGTFGVRKYTPTVKLQTDGTLINCLPVNPIETAKLWETNKEAKEKKIYVRYMNKHSNGFVYLFKWYRGKAKFKNKEAYQFKPQRYLKRTLARNIKDNLIDAYLVEKYA